MNSNFNITDEQVRQIDLVLEEKYLYRAMFFLFGGLSDIGLVNLAELKKSLITDQLNDFVFPSPRILTKRGVPLGTAITFTKDYALVSTNVPYVEYNRKLLPPVKVTLSRYSVNELPIIRCHYETTTATVS
jgi:hypothetical protein